MLFYTQLYPIEIIHHFILLYFVSTYVDGLFTHFKLSNLDPFWEQIFWGF